MTWVRLAVVDGERSSLGYYVAIFISSMSTW